LVEAYDGPIVSRIVRVVDDTLPERDEPFRERLLKCQKLIQERASALILNNTENELRWRSLYGEEPPAVLIPNGCPVEIPEPGQNPFDSNEPAILFLGSLAAPRMIGMMNEAANRLKGLAKFHLVGLNKSGLYGGDDMCSLDKLIVDHGEMPETEVWNYIQHAHIGLALATGPHAFDNDVSKIFNYLRGGLPVLTEDPILTNELVRQTGFGKIFTYGDADDLVAKAQELLDNPLEEKKTAVMRFMVTEHSWEKRVKDYALFLQDLV
jgi:glycosyltransferase involved in cell wall biosynthesis